MMSVHDATTICAAGPEYRICVEKQLALPMKVSKVVGTSGLRWPDTGPLVYVSEGCRAVLESVRDAFEEWYWSNFQGSLG